MSAPESRDSAEPDITGLLRAAADGTAGSQSMAQLFTALYDELHRVAERQLRRHGDAAALSTTTLVHEVYLDICQRSGADFPSQAQFIGYASRAMRGVVIDHLRRSHAEKRGGGAFEITLTGALGLEMPEDATEELERLSDAVDVLAQLEPTLAELVDLHFFCGYSLSEIADLRGVSERTVQRSWRKARLLLRHQMDQPPSRGHTPPTAAP